MKLVLFILLIFPCTLLAQEESQVVGTWRWCVKKKKNKHEDCSDRERKIYTFSSDGTFTTNDEYVRLGKTYIKHGKWSYDGKFLILKYIKWDGSSGHQQSWKIKWIDESLFFVKGREGKFGPMYYMYLRKE